MKTLLKYSNIITALALALTTNSVNTCCNFVLHQPELPKTARKLRKF